MACTTELQASHAHGLCCHKLRMCPVLTPLLCAATMQITFGDTVTFEYATNFSAYLQSQNINAVLGTDPSFVVRALCALVFLAAHAVPGHAHPRFRMHFRISAHAVPGHACLIQGPLQTTLAVLLMLSSS